VWSCDAYGRSPWGATAVTNTAPPGQQIPPPIPGGTGTYQWGVQTGAAPWSYGGWSGATSPVQFLGGGIVVVPDPDNGVARVMAWWPDATTLQVVRIAPDGSRTPVRGGYPAQVSGLTRRNLCQNPSAAAGLNGYVPGAGNPTLTQATRPDGGPAWQVTIANAGTDEILIPADLPGGQTVTIGLDLQLSDRPTSVTVQVGWVDVNGNALAPAIAALTSAQVNTCLGQTTRQVVALPTPDGAAEYTAVRVTANGLPAGGWMQGSRVTIEQGMTDGSYIDGDMLGGSWTGVAQMSTSVYSGVVTVVDGECPLDVPVVYRVYHPQIAGASSSAPPVTLDSLDRAWLTHSANPGQPLQCWPTKAPQPTRTLQRTILPIIGSDVPTALTFGPRQRPSDSLTFDMPTFDYQEQLYTLLDDGSPLLLRAPAAYAYGYGQWLSFGDAQEDSVGRPSPTPGRQLTVPYQEVAAPVSADLVAA
jgi:hypothetical protein